MDEKEKEELGKAPDVEVKVWALGLLWKKLDKAYETLDKIQKFNFFMEARQKRMEEQNSEIISLLKKIAEK